MTTRAHQSQSEYRQGYAHGLAGGERPSRERGASYYGGWLCGKAEREDQQEQKAA